MSFDSAVSTTLSLWGNPKSKRCYKEIQFQKVPLDGDTVVSCAIVVLSQSTCICSWMHFCKTSPIKIYQNRETYTIPEPHLSQRESFSGFPTEAPIFVVGGLTLLKPEGLSASPDTKKQRCLGFFYRPNHLMPVIKYVSQLWPQAWS